jgi:AcrR family transcriptional regulator
MPTAFDGREREDISRRLLEAALDALRHGGLGAASVSKLSSAAGISKGSFYAFHPSKEHLFMEALESIEDRYRAAVAEAASGTGSPVIRLERAFARAFELVEKESALRWLDGAMMERLARALPPERIAAHVAADTVALERLCDAWRTEGLLADGIGPEELAGASYAAFLVAAGLRNLPEPASSSARRVVARGLALSLARGVIDGAVVAGSRPIKGRQ